MPLTAELLAETRRFALRSACRDCAHVVVATGDCGHGWPNQEQRRHPVDAPDPDGRPPVTRGFCKEFELR